MWGFSATVGRGRRTTNAADAISFLKPPLQPSFAEPLLGFGPGLGLDPLDR
jgi:hypothetical protein